MLSLDKSCIFLRLQIGNLYRLAADMRKNALNSIMLRGDFYKNNIIVGLSTKKANYIGRDFDHAE